MKKLLLASVLLTLTVLCSGAFEVTMLGGSRMDIPEAWELDDSDPAVPSWYSPDRRGAAEVLLWEPGTWEDLETFVDNLKPDGADGEIVAFPCWEGEVALADWTFSTSSGQIRGWFLFVIGIGSDVRVSAIAAEEDFIERQPFLLSILDSYIPADDWRLAPGAVSTFLELTGPQVPEVATVPFRNNSISWEQSPAGNQASQDVIEREAIILSAYAAVPELFYPAWERYYRLIYRDSYSRMLPLAEALKNGPLPADSMSERETAEVLLTWLQGFSYGSTSGFSDLLAPSVACAGQTGDCDSLSLALLILMDLYEVDGKLLLSQQALHALSALDLPGEGLRYVEGEKSWVVAELTSTLPLGVLPDRLTGVSDWFGISLLSEE
jgi:hypothetical protein